MAPINLLIKPVSSACNMCCTYCFYRDVADHRQQSSYGIMSPLVTEEMIRNVFQHADSAVSFTFQGGEPTLAGTAFYEQFHSFIDRYNRKNLPVSYSLQTNGLAVPESMVALFAKYRYLLGVSLDGTDKLHDTLRRDHADRPTAQRVNETLKLLDRYGVDYNILCVITREIAEKGEAVYKYFRERKLRYLQFIPYVPDFGEEGEAKSFALDNKRYAGFLSAVFRLYSRDYFRGEYVSIRQFDNFVRIAAGQQPECCGMGGRCFANLVVEADGSVYPCDFYVLDKWHMGNITTDPIPALLKSPIAEAFVRESFAVDASCKQCEYLFICRGGCRRHRETPEGELALNRYCEAYRIFFIRSMPQILEMARHIRK